MYKKLRRWEIAGFLFTALAGPLLHFAYDWSGESRIVAAFSAVNESTWEHMKLLFVPVFLFSLLEMAVLTSRYRNLLAVKLAVTLAGLAAIPTLFYTYTGIVGQGNTAADIAVFYIAAALVYLLGYRLLEQGRLGGGALQVVSLLALWAIAFLMVYCTYAPPRIALFRDPVTGLYGIQ